MKGAGRKVRITVDLSPALYARLERLTELLGAETKATVIRDALRLLEYVAEETADGRRFFREAPNGDKEALVFLGIESLDRPASPASPPDPAPRP
jgi:Arc/MetJ-type ribon-helix-helix transcriptional regulator